MLVIMTTVVFTAGTGTRVGFNLGNNLSIAGVSLDGSMFSTSGGANFFINPVMGIAVPVINLDFSTTTLCSRGRTGISMGSTRAAVARGSLGVPMGMHCNFNLDDLTGIFIFTNPR